MSFYEFLNKQGIEFTQEQDALCDAVLVVKKEDLFTTCDLLKNDRLFLYDILLAVIGLDCVSHFEVLYSLYSTRNNKKLTVKVILDKENPAVESLCRLYSAANWHERECYDLLGIEFLNHPKLERILLPKGWIGHPLRKDYVQEDERLSWNKR